MPLPPLLGLLVIVDLVEGRFWELLEDDEAIMNRKLTPGIGGEGEKKRQSRGYRVVMGSDIKECLRAWRLVETVMIG